MYNNIDSVQFCLWRYLNKNKCLCNIIEPILPLAQVSPSDLHFPLWPVNLLCEKVMCPCLQILSIDRAGMMNDVIMQLKAHDVICAKNTLWLLLSQNGRKRCCCRCNMIETSLPESQVYWRNGKLWWLSRRFHPLTWRA